MANQVHAVGTIFENNKGEILVLRRHKDDPEGNTWGLVGGKIDPGETKEQSAVREIKEEIGIDISESELEFIKTFHWDRPDLDITFEVFKLNANETHKDFILPDNEITDFLWDTPQNLIKRDDLMQGLYDIIKTQYPMNNFASVEKARQVIKDKYPDAQNIRFIEHGYDNLVGLVDDKYAFRFPRMESAYLRSQYERLVLRDLAPISDIAIPKVIGQGENPPYVITSFVPGEHISTSDIRQLSDDEQRKIGENVAKFAYQMHTLLPVEKAKEYRHNFGLDGQAEEPWDIYFENMLNKFTYPLTEQDKVAKEHYKKWTELKYTTPQVVVHDDLHNENLMFKNGKLIGVLDFGDTNIGTPEQELRQMHRINEFVMQSAINKYEELSGQKLNVQAVIQWSILQELAVYAELIITDKKDRPAFARATSNLMRWLPEGNWDTLLNNQNINSKQ